MVGRWESSAVVIVTPLAPAALRLCGCRDRSTQKGNQRSRYSGCQLCETLVRDARADETTPKRGEEEVGAEVLCLGIPLSAVDSGIGQ